MTTEAVAGRSRIRTALSGRAVWIALAVVVTGLAVSGGAALSARSHSAPSAYDATLAPIIAEHNAIVEGWNAFLLSYNAIDQTEPEEIDARAQDGFELTTSAAADAQSVIRSWDQVVPPREMAEAHRLGHEAIIETQNGFVELSEYFQLVMEYGIAFEHAAVEGRERLEHAAKLWDQARRAAKSATN